MYNNTKRLIGTAYTHTKTIFGTTDHGVNIGKTIFSVLHPYIEQLEQNHINKNVMKGLTHYDDIKKRVVDTHGKAENSLNDITDKLKRTIMLT